MASAIDITFPGNLAQVTTAQDLRDIPTGLIPFGTLYIVLDLTGLFYFDSGSFAVDNGTTVIRPADKTPLQAGRWLFAASGFARGPAGNPGGNITSVGLASALSALAVPSGTTTVSTSGALVAGRGLGRFIEVPSTYPTLPAAGQNVWWGTRQGTTARWLLDPEQRLTPEMFGAVGDGVIDDIVALELARDFCTFFGGMPLYLGARRYRISRQLKHFAPFKWFGVGGTFDQSKIYRDAYAGSCIYVDENVPGVIIYSTTDAASVSARNAEFAARVAMGLPGNKYPGANGWQMDRISIVSAGQGTRHDGAIGLEFRTRGSFTNGFVVGHGDDGIRAVVSSDVDNANDAYGNVNGSVINARVIQCANRGIAVGGRDGNNVSIEGFIQLCGSWGVEDSSVLGNRYGHLDISTNNQLLRASSDPFLGAIKASSAVGPGWYAGVYIEPGSGGQALLTGIDTCIGGQLGQADFHPETSPVFAMVNGVAVRSPYKVRNSRGGKAMVATLGSEVYDVVRPIIRTHGTADDSNLDGAAAFLEYYDTPTKWYAFTRRGLNDFWQYPGVGTGVRANASSFPQGIFLGDRGAGPRLFYGTAPPTTGTWQRGDRITNPDIASGSPRGWGCSVSGTPGTWISEGNWP